MVPEPGRPGDAGGAEAGRQSHRAAGTAKAELNGVVPAKPVLFAAASPAAERSIAGLPDREFPTNRRVLLPAQEMK